MSAASAFRRFLPVTLFLLASAGCAARSAGIPDAGDYDLILDGTTVAARPIVKGSVSDAIAGSVEDLRGLQSIVHFRIDRVVRGQLDKTTIQPPSRMAQMQDAISKKEYLDVLNYKDTPTEFERQRFRVAVADPYIVFGIEDGESPAAIPYRLYFKRYKTDDTFILERYEELENPPASA